MNHYTADCYPNWIRETALSDSITDDAVDGLVESVEPVLGGGFGHDVKPVPVEKRRDGRVVHAQHPDRPCPGTGRRRVITVPCRQQGPTGVVDDTTAASDPTLVHRVPAEEPPKHALYHHP